MQKFCRLHFPFNVIDEINWMRVSLTGELSQEVDEPEKR